jgi:hypothetical protein
MYVNTVANSFMLHLYVQHYFYNIIFKVKHTLCIAWGSDRLPPNENFLVCTGCGDFVSFVQWAYYRGIQTQPNIKIVMKTSFLLATVFYSIGVCFHVCTENWIQCSLYLQAVLSLSIIWHRDKKLDHLKHKAHPNSINQFGAYLQEINHQCLSVEKTAY